MPKLTLIRLSRSAIAAIRNRPRGDSHISMSPPTPYPTTCMPPTARFIVERARMNDSPGTTSRTILHCVPENIAFTTYGIARSRNLNCQGMPGTHWSASASRGAAIWNIRAVRGRTKSDDASSSCEATREISGPPNIDRPDSTADPVAS
jgi:hypothetical protein